jgi:hypothetical protein
MEVPTFRRTLVLLILIAITAGLALVNWLRPDVFHSDSIASQINHRFAELKVTPNRLDFTDHKALRVRAAIESGDFATAEQITSEIRARSKI